VKLAVRISIAVLGVLVLAMVAAPFLVDLNDFKPRLESALSDALARPVTLGPLHLHLLAGELSAEGVTIADDPQFGKEPFAQAASLRIGVDLWPLLTAKRLNVRHINIEKPELRLIQQPDGDWNFSTLGAPAKAAEPAAPPAADAGKLALRIDLLRLSGGRLAMIRQGSHLKPLVLEDVDLELSQFTPASAIPTTLSAQLNGGGSLKLNGRLGPIAANVAESPFDLALEMLNVDLAASGLTQSSPGLAGLVSLLGHIQSDGKLAKASGKLKAASLRFTANGQPTTRLLESDFAVEHHFKTHTGTLRKAELHVGSALANLSGTYTLRPNDTLVDLALLGDKMPIPELAAMLGPAGIRLPEGSSLQGGTAHVNLALTGPTRQLASKGKISFDNTRLANFDMGTKLNAVQALAGIRTGSDTEIETLHADVSIGPEGISTDNLTVRLPAVGELSGAGTISPTDELDYRLTAKVKTTGLAAILRDAPIPFLVTGKATNPVFRPDMKSLVKEQIAPRAADAAKGFLRGLLAPKPQN